MRINLRRTLATLATAGILAVLAPLGHGGVAFAADPVCPRGTNWDNITHTCH